MITPYGQPPTDSYSTDDAPAADNLDWQVHRPQPSPIVPYISMPPGSASPELSAAEARRQRQAITFRMLIALAMAVPLTAIAAAASEGTMGGLPCGCSRGDR